MITTVTQKNMITIPAEVRRHFGIKPGYRLDWQPVEGKDEILVRVIPDRGELARRLSGAGRRFSPSATPWRSWLRNARRKAEPMRFLLGHGIGCRCERSSDGVKQSHQAPGLQRQWALDLTEPL